MNEWLSLLMRLVNAILDSINRLRKQAATDSPSEHIANGGLVQRCTGLMEQDTLLRDNQC